MLAFSSIPRHALSNVFKSKAKQQRREDVSRQNGEDKELGEVDEERRLVESIISPLLVQPNTDDTEERLFPALSSSTSKTDRENLPPVIMHKLSKTFPSLGGSPTKVSLASLDLHVPRGEVLGLLGKNGAGKTTSLKILAGMIEASGGLGLVSGYDVSTDLLSVYEW